MATVPGPSWPPVWLPALAQRPHRGARRKWLRCRIRPGAGDTLVTTSLPKWRCQARVHARQDSRDPEHPRGTPGIAPFLGFSSSSLGSPAPARDGGWTLGGGIIPEIPCPLREMSPSCISPLPSIIPLVPEPKPRRGTGQGVATSRGCNSEVPKVSPKCLQTPRSPHLAPAQPPGRFRRCRGRTRQEFGFWAPRGNLGVIFLVNGIVPVFIIKTNTRAPGTRGG